MTLNALEFEPKQIVAMAMIHCLLQGAFIPLLVTFLTSRRKDSKWFRGYVLFVNLLTLSKTIIHVIQGFDALDPAPPRPMLMVVVPIFTTALAAFAQGFFVFRCWQIFQRRLLFVAPFLLIWGCSTVFGIITVITTPQVAFAIWLFGCFTLDLGTTCTTIIYLYRSHTGLGEDDGVFSTVWHVIWASAAPPLLLLAATIVDMYIFPTSTHTVTFFCAGTAGKFFVLSLMVSLVGRGYIREKLELSAKRTLHSNLASQTATNTSAPVFARGDSAVYELEVRNSRTTSQVSTLAQEASQTITESQTDHYFHSAMQISATTKPSNTDSESATHHQVRLTSDQ